MGLWVNFTYSDIRSMKYARSTVANGDEMHCGIASGPKFAQVTSEESLREKKKMGGANTLQRTLERTWQLENLEVQPYLGGD